MSPYRLTLIAAALASLPVSANQFYRLSVNECAALAHYGRIVAEQRDAKRPVAEVLSENHALRADFASSDLFGATIEMIRWVFARPKLEPPMVFEVVWHGCADNGGQVPMSRATDA